MNNKNPFAPCPLGQAGARRRTSPNRRGSVCVVVVGVSIIVAMIGLCSMQLARLQLRATTERNDLQEARRLAASAVALGMANVEADPNWRTNLQNNTEYPSPPVNMGNGTISWKLVDADGDLADNDRDWVRLYGIGRVGGAVVFESVLLEPTDAVLTCLEAAFQCDGDVILSFNDNWTTNQIISSNGDILATATGARIQGDAQAVGNISGNVTGRLNKFVTPPWRMPGEHVFSYYCDNGTWIGVDDLPTSLGNPVIEKIVLSPAGNPYGVAKNPQGIYVIDCAGQNIQVRNCRIVGTLVLLNAGNLSSIHGHVNWAPAVPNFPALLVDGSIDLTHLTGELNEALVVTNFNPPGTPYQGSEDSDMLDTYPSVIGGLVYVSGNLNVPPSSPNSLVHGVVVCGSVTSDDDVTFNYDAMFHANPPPGFRSGSTMIISPGSWQRIASE